MKPNDRKLVAALACRNQGSRLYGKPLQNLDVEKGISILDNIIDCLQGAASINEILLGISKGSDNHVYIDYAENKNIRYIVGDETNVLSRLIECGEYANGTDIFRVTSESPFPSYKLIQSAWELHLKEENDATFLDNVVDGCGFELIKLAALETSARDGEDKHRSELCTLYIRENRDIFKVGELPPPTELVRKDLRLTVDYPEDLILCRAIYSNHQEEAPQIDPIKIVKFIDKNIPLKELVARYCESGYSKMYL